MGNGSWVEDPNPKTQTLLFTCQIPTQMFCELGTGERESSKEYGRRGSWPYQPHAAIKRSTQAILRDCDQGSAGCYEDVRREDLSLMGWKSLLRKALGILPYSPPGFCIYRTLYRAIRTHYVLF